MNTKYTTLTAAIAVAFINQGFAEETVVELEDTTLKSDSVDRDAETEFLTFQDFQDLQVNDMEDLVSMMPGVSISKGDDRWGSSGFNIRGLDEDRVAINVDGIPQGETLKNEGGQAYGYFKGSRNGVDIEAMKSVKIVKGADSILSGSGALAGAVNFTTKDAYDFLVADGDDSAFVVKTGYTGKNNELMGSFTAANRIGKLESLLIYTRRDGSEYENYDMSGADIEGSAREIPDPREVDTESLLAKFAYLASDTQTLGLVYSYYERNGLTDTQSFNGGWYSNRIGDDVRTTNRIGLTYDLKAENTMFDVMEVRVNKQSIDFAANTIQHVTYDFGPTFRADEDRISTRAFNQDLTQVKVDFAKKVGGDRALHSLMYGLEYLDKDFENYQLRRSNSAYNDLGWVDSNRGALIPASEADVYTLYAMDSIEFGEGTKLRVGGRYDKYKYNAESDENYNDSTGSLGAIDFSSFTWGAGLDQSLSETLTASIGISTGFRVPTIEEMYRTSGSLDDWSTVPNPDLKSESSKNLDVAIAGNYDVGSFRFGYYKSKYDDFVEYEPTTGINTNTGLEDPDGYNVPANVGAVDISGYELSGYLNLSKAFGSDQGGFGADFRAAYSEGKNSDGDPLYSIQPYSYSIGLSYANPEGNWGSRLSTVHSGGKNNSDAFNTENDGTIVYPLYLSNSVTTMDLSFFYKINEDIRLSAGIYNLTDEEYYRWDSVRFIDQGDLRPGIGVTGDGIKRYSESGRNARVSLSYAF